MKTPRLLSIAICCIAFLLAQNGYSQCNADFTFDDTDITIQFTDLSTSPANDPIVSWFWDFDDGTTSSQQNPTHTFPSADTYDVELTITTQNGCTSDIRIRIEICEFSISISMGNCGPGGYASATITVIDVYDNADAVIIYVDGISISSDPLDIDGQNPVIVTVGIMGDGNIHTVYAQAEDILTCDALISFTTPDCVGNCSLSLSAVQSGNCDANNNVPVDVTVTESGGGASGFNFFVDGGPDPNNPRPYNSSGSTTFTVTISGDGQSHTLEAHDIDFPGCIASSTLTTIDCSSQVPCNISNLIATSGSGGGTQTVLVEDFQFNPAQITITQGDVVQWQWVGSVQHTSTSDATSGPDSWDSGLLGQGSTYQSPVLAAGVHPYYCIPHGAPGGVGMSGSITVQPDCTNGMVLVNLSFDAVGGGVNGFNVYVDGSIDPGSPYPYSGSGPNSVAVSVVGDGASHTIEVRDFDDPNCTATTTITTSNCNAPTCSMTMSAQEVSGCDPNDNVGVELTINDTGGGASGFNVLVDGVQVGSYNYTPGGVTLVTIDVPGNGLNHTIEVIDIDQPACMASANITTTDCTIPCQITNLVAAAGSGATHIVLVEDFLFNPASVTIAAGDIVEWQWVGAVQHTSTSDATSGPDSWDSGLLGSGGVFTSPVLSAGVHPYYCIPHGAPGGVGMAGSVTVQANCTNGEVGVTVTFNAQGGSFSGFNILVDGAATPGSPYLYDASGSNTQNIFVVGDGQSHTIEVVDFDDPNCSASVSISTPDCNAPTCSMTMSAQEVSGCDPNDNVGVELTINDTGGGASGFNVLVDGVQVGSYNYTPGGVTLVTIDVPGNGLNHTIEVIDIDQPACMASANVTTTDCTIPCQITNLAAAAGSGATHIVLVEDFLFNPASVTIAAGDIVEWQWVGAVQHTSTSDATSGPDSWDSGLLGSGGVFTSPVLSAGVHPYYCIPHGAPGGVGMAGSVTVQANCTNGEVGVTVTFNAQGGSFSGFNILVDGAATPGSPYLYDASGSNTQNIFVVGDGQSHTIEVVDFDDPNCSASASISTPDCNAPTCSMTMSAQEVSGCDPNDNVGVELTINDTGGGASGFNVLVDGVQVGSYNYTPGGVTLVTIDVPGNGLNHTIEVIDIDQPACMASANITTTDCTIPCQITNLVAAAGSGATHIVLVEDFLFNPASVTIAAGDIVEWQWVGAVQHTSTSDATSGPDSWDSGLLGSGGVFTSPVLSAGVHPYYCIPHGAPGGVGMAGSVTVQANCTNGEVGVTVTFNAQGGSFSGFNILVDGAATPGSPYLYDASGSNTQNIFVVGDGQSHTIEVVDFDDPNCSASASISTPDCNAPTCSMTMSAQEVSGCDPNDNVGVELTINDTGGGASGFNVLVDGVQVGSYNYTPGGVTLVTIDVPGNGLNHTIEVIDIDQPACMASANITTTDCTIPCQITNLVAAAGSGSTHIVLVEDFLFNPASVTIAAGDIVEWQWVGAVQHTSTSDATSGPDSWDSGLLGSGGVFTSPVLSAGVHPYYCIPHGAPGGVGMSGSVTVQANCTNGEVGVTVSFNAQGGSFSGFNILVDGAATPGSPYLYDASGSNTQNIFVVGDGQSHTIEVVDFDDPNCSASASISTPDCNAPTCSMTMSAQEVSGCDPNDNVGVELTINDTGGGASGFNVLVDGVQVGSYNYTPGGVTLVTIDVPGNGLNHTIEVIDIDQPACMASANVTTTDCTIPCNLSNLSLSSSTGIKHIIEVQDFQFFPKDVTIVIGDTVEFIWTGVVAHTTTSDSTGTVNSWDSGLLGQGSNYQIILSSEGLHPYYCIPHGAPGGIGMAGTIEVIPNCFGDSSSINLTFESSGGSFDGYDVFVDQNKVNNGPFSYNSSGTNLFTINVIGDNNLHLIEIVDVLDTLCTVSDSIQFPDCIAQCELSLEIIQFGACDNNDQVPLEFNVYSGNTSDSLLVFFDSTIVDTFAYDSLGITTLSILVPGDANQHNLYVRDLENDSCSATLDFISPDCVTPCVLSNISASGGTSATHIVEVRDFEFSPKNLSITAGDIVEWRWTGAVAHTATSDATAGADSWDSGLLGQGATFTSPVLSAGVHSYYCTPHGAPGGIGMAGTITVVPDCNNGMVSVAISFNEQGGSGNGFNVFVDGSLVAGGPFTYDPSGSNTISVLVNGDGLSHLIMVQDTDEPACAISTSFTTPDCNAPTCQMSLAVEEITACDNNDLVGVQLTISETGGGSSGFNVIVDGTLQGSFAYTAGGTTLLTIDVAGDGNSHSIEVVDIDEISCSASDNIITTNCAIPCVLSNLSASGGTSATHIVEVRDFEFSPKNLSITAGDIVEWRWTGAVAHTATSDATSGADSWDSGLLGQGATFTSPVLSAGVHSYYCTPHGAPGGIGMAGTITVVPDCNNGMVSVAISFNEQGGSGNGFNVFVDGSLVAGGPFTYDPSGSNTISILVNGDGLSHLIMVQDTDEPACAISTSFTTPDCNAPTCQMSLAVEEITACDNNDLVGVQLTISETGGGSSGFNVIVDGSLQGSFAYTAGGTTLLTIDVAGDGNSHSIEVVDIDEISCSAFDNIITTNCAIPCVLSNLSASGGTSATHIVEVRDFEFSPKNLSITAGDIVEWRWTGAVAHTATSDATSGADSWDSGLLGQGATFTSPVLSAGVHSYYCTPHGAPGGIGMAGTITVVPDCNNGMVSVAISFNEQGGSGNGFNVFVDGSLLAGGPFTYDPSGSNTISVLVNGDGLSHLIMVQDTDEPACAISTSFTTPDCNAPTCQMSLAVEEVTACDNNDLVGVQLTISETGGGSSGFNVIVDGTLQGSYAYTAGGTTLLTIDVAGDGNSHSIEVVDIDEISCSAFDNIITTNCAIPCVLSNLSASGGTSATHIVEVRDFEFSPKNLSITAGDIVEWRWTGAVAHTATSDATAGADSWDSGLLGQGATFTSPVLSAGVHSYYCTPHGAPGGIGMAGTITVVPDCNNGMVSVAISFNEQGGSGNGFNVFVDGSLVAGGPFTYDTSGSNTISVLVNGDGLSHLIMVQDTDEPTCALSTSFTTPDCNAPTCQMSLAVEEVTTCDNNDLVGVQLTISETGGGSSGFNVIVDGSLQGSFAYTAGGTTLLTIDVAGDGNSHSIEVVDIDEVSCSASGNIVTTNCTISCNLSNLILNLAGNGTPITHLVEVRDFEFSPKDILVNTGDIVKWEWTGQIPHTTTSDTTAGVDNWDSGLLGQGAIFEHTIATDGIHPYYCIPHGAPGGIGMAGTITASSLSGCDSLGQVPINLSFESSGGSTNGYQVLLDGNLIASYPYNSGSNNQTLAVVGDGLSHLLEIIDADDPACRIGNTIELPDCNLRLPCELQANINNISSCDSSGNVTIEIDVAGSQTGNNGFNVFIDGNLYLQSPFAYAGPNTTITLEISGTGQNRLIEIIDIDSIACKAVLEVATPLCGPVCEVQNLQVSTDTPGKYIVEVKDFEFSPKNLEVRTGDTVEFVWTGVIPHTSTSDALSGPDSWSSGLLGQGSVYKVVINTAGDHPYYCIPHGGPGGIGMAGNIRAKDNCNNGVATIGVHFEITNGSNLGYNLFLDGSQIAGPISYNNPSGQNSTLIELPGDGAVHLLTVQDLDVDFCAATIQFTAPECEVLCEIQNLSALTGDSVVHEIEVRDFEFSPVEVNIRTGHQVRFLWTGNIPHTTTSDAINGVDSWDSGLLGNGAEYTLSITNPGEHPYYCIPHGGPGGIGMAGNIRATEDCENGEVEVQIRFSTTNGSSQGYNVFIDGAPYIGNPVAYDDPRGMNSLSLSMIGDGMVHRITVQDLEVSFCASTVQVEVANCNAACEISEIEIILPQAQSHTVEARDFDFFPKDLDIQLGDTIHFIWTGQIPHTTTSDLIAGVDSWDSGLLGQGSTYDLVLETAGVHPYYCTPHGGPGGIGMAGTINVADDKCENGMIKATLNFTNQGTGSSGFNLTIDGIADANNPYPYASGGINTLDIFLPGDGMEHEIIVADADDVNCSDTILVRTENCDSRCQLTGEISSVGSCDSNNEVAVMLSIQNQNSGLSYRIYLDDTELTGSPFQYDPSGISTQIIFVPGDGLLHNISIEDTDSLNCKAELELQTEDCNPPCSLELTANQLSGCDNLAEIPYQLSIFTANAPSDSFIVLIDGLPYVPAVFVYSGNPTQLNISLPGDGNTHLIEVQDQEEPACRDTVSLLVPDCNSSCKISHFSTRLNVPLLHIVEVRDFDFLPKNITVSAGDTVRWIWTGEIPHTVTSDSTSGNNVWDSGLLGKGSTYSLVMRNAGYHPYYCIPHGAPGGIGMAGSITVEEVCEDGKLNVEFLFREDNRGFGGYNVYLENELVSGSPFQYNSNGIHRFVLEIAGDGQEHPVSIEDVLDMSCRLDTFILMPNCNDPCFGFHAEFTADFDPLSLEVQFNSLNEEASSWLWTFGTGDTSLTENPLYLFTQEGTYEVCLQTMNDLGCTASHCDTIEVGAYQCEARFNIRMEGLTLHLTDQSITSETITQWTWNMGNSNLIVGQSNPTYTYDSLGIYEICLTIEAGNCVDDTCIMVSLTDPCLVFLTNFAYSIDGASNSVQFVDISSGNPNQWLWGFGDGNTSTEQNPKHTYANSGAYTICLLAQNTVIGCNQSSCERIYVGVTSTQEPGNKNRKLRIYPNPTAAYYPRWTIENLEPEDHNSLLSLQLYNVEGKRVVEEEVRGSEQIQFAVNRDLPAGLYILRMRSERNYYVSKLIIQ